MQNEDGIHFLEPQARTLTRIVCLVCCLFVLLMFMGCSTRSTAVDLTSAPLYDLKDLTPQQLDTLLDRDDSPIDTWVGRKDTLKRIRHLLDVELSQENIDAFFNRQGAHVESAATAELAHFLLQMGISLSKESIDGFRKKLEALEETELKLQALEDRYDAINREIPMSELRSRTLLSVYTEIMGLSGTVNHDDFTISEVELNRNIDSIIRRAMEGEWDNDTNVRILNTYSLSYKNFADKDKDNVLDTTDNCHLYNPDQADCNGNHIGDVCDIANGISEDFNNNGIPDECE